MAVSAAALPPCHMRYVAWEVKGALSHLQAGAYSAVLAKNGRKDTSMSITAPATVQGAATVEYVSDEAEQSTRYMTFQSLQNPLDNVLRIGERQRFELRAHESQVGK